MVLAIGLKVVERKYASPARARSAVIRSRLGKAEKKRLLTLIDGWEKEPTTMTRSGSGAAELAPVIGSMPAEAALSTVGNGSAGGSIRFETIRHAHTVLRELARDKHVELTELLDEVQAYELSIRQEVERREREGSLEEPS